MGPTYPGMPSNTDEELIGPTEREIIEVEVLIIETRKEDEARKQKSRGEV